MEDEYDFVVELCDLKRFGEARARLDHLIAEYPDDPGPILLLANVHILEGSPRAAREAIDRAMIVTPDLEARDLVAASRLFHLLGDVTQAIAYGRRAVEVDPGNWMAHEELAAAYAAHPKRNLMVEAEYHAAKAAELAPGEPETQPTPGKRVERRFPRDSIRQGVLVVVLFLGFMYGSTVLKWLGHRVEDLMAVDRPRDEFRLVGLLIVVAVGMAGWGIFRAIRVRRGGDRIGPAIQRRRAVSRELHVTIPDKLAVSATNFAAWLCFLPFLVTTWLGVAVLDEKVPPHPGAVAAAAAVVAALSLFLWPALRWWLGPGQPRRFLTASLTLCVYLLITGGLMVTTIIMAAAQVMNEGFWIAVTVLHFAWILAAIVPMIKVSNMGRLPS
ncbi:hypothetical protein Aph01nite_70290 [Acrocarpospora phusangensis]|uniref:Tetratricopeptide repeat protein n=1 Tax=Acrocarpospora phusangensis TaxID=1070424 RepID=A0A919QIM9_9ACTN|nr:tetratricopeptide repeat protein [Acrocarpospora phusangensis]GIH28719.1 hypothetical protein Aph01nite_70290 [Acrocarpospora phusangensis]